MQHKHLEYFLHLTKSQSYTKSAAALHLSPSALTRIIQRLEEEIGLPLFIRDNRSVTLTNAGKKLVPIATEILDMWQNYKWEIDEEQNRLQGKLTLYCSVTASFSHLPSILDKFRQTYPQIEIQLLTGDPASAVDIILNNKADVAIAAKPDHLPNSVYLLPLEQLTLSLIAPITPPKSLNKFIVNQDIKKAPFILPESGAAREKANHWFKRKKIKPNIYAQVAGHEAIISMVALGCGIGIAPDVVIENSMVQDKIEKLSTHSIEPIELGICCRQSNRSDPLIKAFLDLF